jgi:hypothetical protein
MKYTIRAHPTEFRGTMYRSRLEARWAAFFHLAGIDYQYEPVDLPGWSPDFRITWACGHSMCPANHSILIEVKPYPKIEDFNGHKCMKHFYGHGDIPACSSAAFGENPWVTYWQMCHGSGGGEERLEDNFHWITEHRHGYREPSGLFVATKTMDQFWAEAGSLTQWFSKFRKERGGSDV